MSEPAKVPRGWIRFNVGLQTFAVFVLLLAVNYFSFDHYGRWDFSRSQEFDLSEQTKRVIRMLKPPGVKVFVFFSPTSASPEQQIGPDVKNFLKELIFSGRKMISVEYVDPVRDLSRARELQAKYKFNANENVLILDYNGQVKFLPVMDMADFDLTPLQSGEPPRLIAFKGEQAITNALISLVNPEARKIFFLQGHGEPGVGGSASPLSTLRDYIARQNVGIDILTLASTDHVPKECSVLAIIAPQTDIEEREALIIESFWKNRGRLLVLLDPAAKTPHLDAVLERAGIIPRDDRVLRLLKNPLLPNVVGIWRTVTGEFMPDATVSKRLVGTNIVLSGASQSLKLDDKVAKAAGVQLFPAIRAGEEYWGETDYIPDEKKGVHYDDGVDTGYPIYVAATATLGGVSDERVEVESSKLVVVGNSEFALDASLSKQPQALDFLLSSFNWLLDRGSLTGVMPKTIKYFSLTLTDAQLGFVATYAMIVIPGVAALLGIFVWWRRRS